MAKKWTLADYRYALRLKLDELESDFYTDDELNNYINEAIGDMAVELQIEETKTVQLNDQNSIDYSDLFVDANGEVNILQLKGVFIDGLKLPQGRLEDKYREIMIFTLFGNKMLFGQKITGTLDVYYHRMPAYMENDTDTTDVPVQYQAIPLLYAMAECKRKEADENLSDGIMMNYMRLKAEMQQEIEQKDTNDFQQSVNISYLHNSNGNIYNDHYLKGWE
jgi:hypothetical protein